MDVAFYFTRPLKEAPQVAALPPHELDPFTPQTHWFIAPRAFADNDPLYLYDNNQLGLHLSA